MYDKNHVFQKVLNSLIYFQDAEYQLLNRF
jgi:hypothetical protein